MWNISKNKITNVFCAFFLLIDMFIFSILKHKQRRGRYITRFFSRFCRILCTIPAVVVVLVSPGFCEDETNFERKLQIQTKPITKKTTVYISISAQGTFYIDWGDGTIETKNKPTTDQASYSHSYPKDDVNQGYSISIGGLATGYYSASGTTYNVSAISFYRSGRGGLSTYIKTLSGSLGAIFPTIGNTSGLTGTALLEKQPRFIQTFRGASSWQGNIPAGLFSGVNGDFAPSMYRQTFYQCSALSGYIPGTLFNNMSTGNAPINEVMSNVFYQTTNLATVCPTGTEQIITGYESYWNSRVACSVCPAGQYSTAPGSSCTECPTGTYNPNTGSTSASDCISCAAGTYNNLTGQSACTQCVANTYNPDTGSTSALACLACPTNTTSPAGSTSANDCTSSSSCPNGMPRYNGTCAMACTGLNYLKTNNVSIPVFGNKLTTHTLHVLYNGNDCYVPMESGSGTNTLNMQHGNDQYHAVIVQ